jgi:hypothetical protein
MGIVKTQNKKNIIAVSSNLADNLKKQYNKRSVNVIKGDTVIQTVCYKSTTINGQISLCR